MAGLDSVRSIDRVTAKEILSKGFDAKDRVTVRACVYTPTIVASHDLSVFCHRYLQFVSLSRLSISFLFCPVLY